MLRGGFYYIDCEGFNFTKTSKIYYISDSMYNEASKSKKPCFITNFKINGKEYNPLPLNQMKQEWRLPIVNSVDAKQYFGLHEGYMTTQGYHKARIQISDYVLDNY